LPNGDPVGFARDLARDYTFLGTAAALRLAHSYGSDARCILASARRTEDLGRGFGYGFSERELDWLVKNEWALTGEDVLWRRSKLGLHLDSDATGSIIALLTGYRVTR
jgi:glycerol-3-phosphate dehydrogenase